MMVVGTSLEDANELCQLEHLASKIQVAAVNSSSSITLSGDEDAVAEAVEIFKDEGKFARQLKVDTAYHSAHMIHCSEPYMAAMDSINDKSTVPETLVDKPVWYSSVLDGNIMTLDDLSSSYWASNMVQPVLFAPAIRAAVKNSGAFDLVLEIGPHPALKGPCLYTLAETIDNQIPYTGLLSRNKNDVLQFSTALGFVWSNLGAGAVTFENFEKLVSGNPIARKVIPNLPKYPFDHSRSFWTVSRAAGAQFSSQDPPHPILGRRCVDRETSEQIQWRNILTPTEIPWLKGHRIQGGIVFPAAGYVAMAVEAMNIFAGKSPISLFHIESLSIGRAIAFNEETSTIESLFTLKILRSNEESIEAEFSCCSGTPSDTKWVMTPNAEGKVTVILGKPEADTIYHAKPADFNMSEVEVDRFYDQIHKLGYEYSHPFRGMLSIKRRKGHAIGTMEDQGGSGWEDQLLIHPGMLDTAIQSSSAAFGCPGDGTMWGLYIPTGIQSICINPYFTNNGIGKQQKLPWQSVSRGLVKTHSTMDINIFSQDDAHTFIQMEGLELMPFAAARPEDDALMFSALKYELDKPSGDIAALGDGWDSQGTEDAIKGERVSFYYLRHLIESITPEEKARALPYYRHLLNWAAHAVDRVKTGKNPYVPPSCVFDTEDQINMLWGEDQDRVDVKLIKSVGNNLPHVVRQGSSILEFMKGLFDFYDQGLGLDKANRHLARMIAQLSHRYPRMKIFEIGAGTGGSTRHVLDHLGDKFSNYTYTDISSGFFEAAQELFKKHENRMVYQTYDMERDPESQGFVPGHYDLILASNVLHATDKLEDMMINARRLLKPGGYLIALELANNDSMRVGLPMGSLPGWWVGAENGRPWGPTVTLPQWDALLRKCGFGGIDTTTPMLHKLQASIIFAAQAVDDRITLLRSPLESMKALPPTEAPRLVIVGGEALITHRIAEKAANVLRSRYNDIVHVTSFEDLDLDALPYASTVLSLTDLDEPVFKCITPQKFEALKTLWRQAYNIVWVTKGARAAEPYSSMMIGLGRAMIHEYPNISLQLLDVDHVEDEDRAVNIFLEELLRLELLNTWGREVQEDRSFLWSIEPEVYFEGRARLLPRLYISEEANARYNSSRRPITKMSNWDDSPILLSAEFDSYELQEPSKLRVPSQMLPYEQTKSIQVSHFLLQSIEVASVGKLMLCAGVDSSTGQHLLALSYSMESRPTVPLEWAVRLPEGEDDIVGILRATGAQLVAKKILELAAFSGTVVIHEPTHALAVIIHQQIQKHPMRLILSTSNKDRATQGWLHVPPNLPKHLIKKAIPESTTVYVDLSHISNSRAIGELIRECVPKTCRTYNYKALYGNAINIRPSAYPNTVSETLESALKSAFETRIEEAAPTVVKIEDLKDVSVAKLPLSVVDCSINTVSVTVQAIDSGVIFRGDRTYLLVGMSGQVGQSLCQWMVEHGARYVVLTSRRPQVHPDFISSMKEYEATVKVLPS